MRSTPLIIWAGQALAATGTVTSNPQSVVQAFGYAVQIVWTGTPTGSFTLEGSCDAGNIQPGGLVTGITNWTTITGSATAASGSGGSALINVADVNYQWFRVKYTASSGTGTALATASIKGI